MPSFADLASEYTNLWARMEVKPGRVAAVDKIARKLLASKARYQAVAAKTGVPWPMVAALHNRESDADFSTQLAQGDPLNSVSVHEPTGRGPFSTWEEGAIDALVTLKHLDQVKDWSPARICYETERYNGFGPRGHGINSGYLWSYSKHYERGKYVKDGPDGWDPSVVDIQCGAIPIVKHLLEIDASAPKPQPKTPAGKGLVAILIDLLAMLFARKPARKAAPIAPKTPAWMTWAQGELGFHERPGNRGIEKYIALAHCGSIGDPWCAIFANAGLEASGIPGTRSAMACSFETSPNFVMLAGPAFGAITTMWRGSKRSAGEEGQGHVFYYVGENKHGVLALGGNQSDQVARQYEPQSRIVGYYWPKNVPLPEVGAIIVEDDGGLRAGSEA